MLKILIINGHPDLDHSVSNKTIIDTVLLLADENNCSSDIELRSLAKLYPDYKIDKKAEQDALLNADIIVLQFPFFWYSVPAILKLWIDTVLEYGFAYGKTGNKLHGKKLLLSLTTGGPEDAYSESGRNHYQITDLVRPLIQTSNLIGTQFLEPVVSFGMPNIPGIDSNHEIITAKAVEHAQKLYKIITK